MDKNESMGAIANIVTEMIGGIVFNLIGAQKVTWLNLYSVIVSVVGACILLWIIGKLKNKNYCFKI